jgi:hypothetical protein
VAFTPELTSKLIGYNGRLKLPTFKVTKFASVTTLGPFLFVAECYSYLKNIINISNHQQCFRRRRQLAL